MTEELNDEDSLRFAPESSEDHESGELPRRCILIVDDDEDVHLITKMVLKKCKDQMNLELKHAYSAADCQSIMSEARDEVDLILLDVVMEHDAAGFQAARYIREDLSNRDVKIIIRTGQPGVEQGSFNVEGLSLDGFYQKTELDAKTLRSIVEKALLN